MVDEIEKDIQILVVDDHQVVREGLRRMLGQEEDMELIGQGANSEEALFQVELLSPNIVLMDIKMPGVDGIELTRQIKQKHPSSKVIMLTLYDEYLTQAMEAGANGYLLKDIKREDLTQAIRRVHGGEVVISDGITPKPQIEHEENRDEKIEALWQEHTSPDAILEELQLVILPPIEASQLMRFTNQVEDILQSRVLQVVGSWHEGTVITLLLTQATPLAAIWNKLEDMSEIEAIGEAPLSGKTSPRLLTKAGAVPRLKNRSRKTIFVTFENAGAEVAS